MSQYNTQNPADIPAEIPRPNEDYESRYLDFQGQRLQSRGYPQSVGPPDAPSLERFHKYDPDNYQATISPQNWDTDSVYVPASGGGMNPVEIWPRMQKRASLLLTNTGTHPVLVSPNMNKALNGRGQTVAVGATFEIDTQASAYAVGVGGTSEVQITWTYWDEPDGDRRKRWHNGE